MHKLFTALLVSFLTFALYTSSAFAGPGPCDGREDLGNCVGGRTCVGDGSRTRPYEATGPACGSGTASEVIGEVVPPKNIAIFNSKAGGGIGLLVFANTALVLITVVAGLFVMFNFIKAGWMFLVAGDNTKATTEVRDLLTFSVIGLTIIAVAYTIAGLVGLIFFGDAGYILNPQLESAVSAP